MEKFFTNDYLINKILEYLQTITPRENIYDVFITGSCLYPNQYISPNDIDVVAVLYDDSNLNFGYKFKTDGVSVGIIINSYELLNNVKESNTTDFRIIFQTSFFLNSLLLKTPPDLDKFLSGEAKWKANARDYIFNHLLSKKNGYYQEFHCVPRLFYNIIIQLEIYKQKTFDINVVDIIKNIKSYKNGVENYEQWKNYCEIEMDIIHN